MATFARSPAAPRIWAFAGGKGNAIRRQANLRSQIQSGQMQPGDRLPSIARLREQFGVSYGTVRGAMLTLKAEGLIVGRQCEGVFVAQSES